jgi:hypothetical protein
VSQFKGVELPDEARTRSIEQLSRLANSAEALANPEIRGQLDRAVRALEHAEAKGDLIPAIIQRMEEMPNKSSAINRAISFLSRQADNISGGEFGRLKAEHSGAVDRLKGAKGAEALRETFMSAGGAPLTARAYGDQAVGGATPVLRPAPLSRALAAKGEEVMEPSRVQHLSELADELRQHEIYAPTPGLGVTQPEMGAAQGLGVAAVNASPAWRARGVAGTVFGAANKATTKVMDAALLNPEKFLETMAAKRALNRPLTEAEKTVESMLRAQARAAGASSTGEDNAPR